MLNSILRLRGSTSLGSHASRLTRGVRFPLGSHPTCPLSTTSANETPPILLNLDGAQETVVNHGEGPLLVVAGPGTGKSHVIASRMVSLVHTGMAKSSELLTLTFTEKSAFLMENRVDLSTPIGANDATIKTFHSFGSDLLQEFGGEVGIDANFHVMSFAEQIMLLRGHLNELQLKRYRPTGDSNSALMTLLDFFGRLEGLYLLS